MPSIKITENFHALKFSSRWEDSKKFHSKNRLVDQFGKPVSSNYQGTVYEILSKKEYKYSFFERTARGMVGVAALIATLGLAVFDKNIRNLFKSKKAPIRFAVAVSNATQIPPKISDSGAAERLKKLIPQSWFDDMNIPMFNFALPSDYKLIAAGTPNKYFWCKEGDKIDLSSKEANFKNDTIEISFNSNFSSISSNLTIENLIADNIKEGVKQAKLKKHSWGKVTVLEVNGELLNGALIRKAWIYLDPGGYKVVEMVLHCSKTKQTKQVPLWDNLMSHTTFLPKRHIYKLLGFDLEGGYTIFSEKTAKIKFYAQKRISDNLIAIKIEPLTPNTKFKYKYFKENQSITDKKIDYLEVDVAGAIKQKNSKSESIVSAERYIHVFVKVVEKFEFDTDPKSAPTGGHVITKPSEL